MTSDLRAAVDAALPGVRADLERLVRIPSVSADPARAAAVRECADAVAALFREVGMSSVDVLAVEGGAPAVVARHPAPAGAPTVLLYAHPDVQPTGDRAAWHSEPFEPTSATGGCTGAARRTTRRASPRTWRPCAPTAAARRSGSPSSSRARRRSARRRSARSSRRTARRSAADVIVVADSGNLEVGVPALTTTLRGLVDCVVEVSTLDHAVHSGIYGGPVPDALTTLCGSWPRSTTTRATSRCPAS